MNSHSCLLDVKMTHCGNLSQCDGKKWKYDYNIIQFNQMVKDALTVLHQFEKVSRFSSLTHKHMMQRETICPDDKIRPAFFWFDSLQRHLGLICRWMYRNRVRTAIVSQLRPLLVTHELSSMSYCRGLRTDISTISGTLSECFFRGTSLSWTLILWFAFEVDIFLI